MSKLSDSEACREHNWPVAAYKLLAAQCMVVENIYCKKFSLSACLRWLRVGKTNDYFKQV